MNLEGWMHLVVMYVILFPKTVFGEAVPYQAADVDIPRWGTDQDRRPGFLWILTAHLHRVLCLCGPSAHKSVDIQEFLLEEVDDDAVTLSMPCANTTIRMSVNVYPFLAARYSQRIAEEVEGLRGFRRGRCRCCIG